MKLNTMRFFVVIVFVFSALGCATTAGKRIDNSKINEIKNGETTEREIRGMFGKPYSVTQNSEGKKILHYVYASSKADAKSFIPIVGLFVGETRTESESLSVTISANTGIVENHSYTKSESDTKTGILSQ